MSESMTLDVDIHVSTETNRVLHLIPFGFGTYYSFILNDPC